MPKRTQVRQPGLPHSLPRARLLNPHPSDISSARMSLTDRTVTDLDSSNSSPFDILRMGPKSQVIMLTATLATTASAPAAWDNARARTQGQGQAALIWPRPEPVLNTPQAPNRRLPNRP